MTSAEASGIEKLIRALHEQNRGDIDDLKKDQNYMKKTQDEQTGMIKAILMIGKVLAWILGIMVAGLGIWLTSIEARHKVADEGHVPAISQVKPLPQSAHQ